MASQRYEHGALFKLLYVDCSFFLQGQYNHVLRVELPKLQAAFKVISPSTPYKPRLSIIVCGKRHHARFWPVDCAHATKNGNTQPGTVVDKGITDTYNFDFYLQV